MSGCSTRDLCDKEVINTCDGRRLGYIIDFEIDVCSGRLLSIIVPGGGGLFGFKRANDLVIPWEKIVRIGEDAILVEAPSVPPSDGCTSKDCCPPKKHGRFFG